jgi:hypothetical protein
MTNKNFFIGMLVLVLAFSVVVVSCDNGNNGLDDDRAIGELPVFEGNFVASEDEATALAIGVNAQIQVAIEEALTQGGPKENRFAGKAAVSQNEHYEYNGIVLDYTVSGDASGNSYTAKYIVSIDGTYGGYKVKGKYNFDLEYTGTSTESRTKYIYDCIYTVSYSGTGMKVITTGDMIMTITFEPSVTYSYNYNLHYAVYDNSNVRRYNYDYNQRYP